MVTTPASSAAHTPATSPAMGAAFPLGSALPVVPGYEAAVLNSETFVPSPQAAPPKPAAGTPLQRKKSLFRRRSQRYQLQHEIASTPDSDEEDSTVTRAGPEQLMGPQVDATLEFLYLRLQLKPTAYSHALFSHAFDGVGEAVEERRSVMWVTQPLIVTDETAHLVDMDADWSDPETIPPAPWQVDFESCLPPALEDTFEVSLEVPNTNFYRTCFHCAGKGTCRCTACKGNALILCKPCKSTGTTKSGGMCDACQGLGCNPCTKCKNSGKHQCPVCQGHAALRMFILLRAVWQRHVARLVDANGYPLQPSTSTGDLLADVDARYATTNVHALPQELLDTDANTARELVAFADTLRATMARGMHSTSLVRSFAYNIRVIPLLEMVYTKRKLLRKQKQRLLVYGHSVHGVLRVGNQHNHEDHKGAVSVPVASAPAAAAAPAAAEESAAPAVES